MIKNNLQTILLGVITLLVVFLYFLSAQPLVKLQKNYQNIFINPIKEEKKALTYLNELRQGAGLIPFNSNDILKRASRHHVNYLIKNHTYGHYEDQNRSGFTGKFASDRVRKEGYNTSLVIENVSSNNRNYKESIDGLFAAIYHRFAFLDFQGDEIGIAIQQNQRYPTQTSYVYTIGSSMLNLLYKKNTNPSKKILNEALDHHKALSNKMITYPFDQQRDVPPVFFNELPDPLPNYDVSGFPVTISFNQAFFKNIKLLKFKLFKKESEIGLNSIVYDYKTDPNRRLNRFSFALLPLERLEWNQEYQVKFLAVVDRDFIEKEWSFKTRNPKIPLHKIEDEYQTINIRVNEANLFYFPPKTAKDLLHNVRYDSDFKMEFFDQNTVKLTALKHSFLVKELEIGSHHLKLNIQN